MSDQTQDHPGASGELPHWWGNVAKPLQGGTGAYQPPGYPTNTSFGIPTRFVPGPLNSSRLNQALDELQAQIGSGTSGGGGAVDGVMLLRSYGFLGDGSGATLATRFATVAEAQAVYPHAIALTDTLDWAAIQGVLNARGGLNGFSLILPPCEAILNRTIITGAYPVLVRGEGPRVSRLIWTANVNGWQHGLQGSAPTYFATFAMEDVGLFCGANGGAGVALDVRMDTNSGIFNLTDVHIDGFSDTSQWSKAIHASGTSNANFTRLFTVCGAFNTTPATPTPVAVDLVSDDQTRKLFGINFNECSISAHTNAVRVTLTGTGSVEGLIFNNCFGRTNNGPWLNYNETLPSTWRAPYIIFNAFNYQGPGQLYSTTAQEDVHINDGLFYCEAPIAGAAVSDFIFLGDASHAWLKSNSFVFVSGSQTRSGVRVATGSGYVTLRDNLFYATDNTVVIADAIHIETGCIWVTESGTVCRGWPAGAQWVVDVDGVNAVNGALRSTFYAPALFGRATGAFGGTVGAMEVSSNKAFGLRVLPSGDAQLGPCDPVTGVLSSATVGLGANGNFGVTGRLTVATGLDSSTGLVSLTDTAVNINSPLVLRNTVSTQGCNLRLFGNGAVTPSKTLRAANGTFQIVNDAYGGIPLTLTDAGALTISAGLGVFGAAAPAAKPTVSGSRGGNAALASLITALAATGLIADGTTA